MAEAASRSSVLKIEEIPGKGKGIIATQSLKAGQVILTESPLLLYSASPLISSSSSSSHSYCDHCFTILTHTNFHPNCPFCPHHHRFCSQNCLSIALKSSHTPFVCHILSRLTEQHFPSPDLQIQARLVVAAFNLYLLRSSSAIDVLLTLHGTPDGAILDSARFLHSLISPLCDDKNNNAFFSIDLIAQIIAKDRINSFCLMDPYSPDGPQRKTKAFAIYPYATFFNHSCIPNACRFDHHVAVNGSGGNKNEIVIRLIEDVHEGKEICISYFRIGRDYSTRKRILMKDYGFVCECDRCKIEMKMMNSVDDDDDGENLNDDLPHVRFLRKYVCDRENCAGTMAPLPPKELDDDETMSHVLECNFCGNLKLD